ncbi:hypothetical protein ACIRG4_15470 [Streptomyces sp. NPDC102395]|uniref:hypothetical protein n=1 Tax=Streptomyces sp. NPDC102395 TaxID=3366168 RepID=UPI0037F68268
MTTVDPRPAARRRPGDHQITPAATDRWPDVTTVPRASWPVRAVTASVLEHALRRLPLRLRFADGTALGLGGPLIEVRDPKAFCSRIGTHGLIGFGESYMAREWDAPDLVGALTGWGGSLSVGRLAPQRHGHMSTPEHRAGRWALRWAASIRRPAPP